MHSESPEGSTKRARNTVTGWQFLGQIVSNDLASRDGAAAVRPSVLPNEFEMPTRCTQAWPSEVRFKLPSSSSSSSCSKQPTDRATHSSSSSHGRAAIHNGSAFAVRFLPQCDFHFAFCNTFHISVMGDGIRTSNLVGRLITACPSLPTTHRP